MPPTGHDECPITLRGEVQGHLEPGALFRRSGRDPLHERQNDTHQASGRRLRHSSGRRRKTAAPRPVSRPHGSFVADDHRGDRGGFLFANAAFALAYTVVGGVAHLAPGSFSEAFFFSVQTMGTIGYGAMYPESFGANLLVVAETIVGLTLLALATGLVFAKFSRPTARVMFTREAVICPVNGVPALMFRLGNERGNRIVDTQIRAVLVRTERTSEGAKFYRSVDLKLARDRALSLSRSWSVMHSIDEHSPLYGLTPEQLIEQEV